MDKTTNIQGTIQALREPDRSVDRNRQQKAETQVGVNPSARRCTLAGIAQTKAKPRLYGPSWRR
jgi:hypothetical protein